MAARPSALRLASDQSPLAAALERLAASTAAAGAWKSPFWSAAEPEKPPACTSTRQAPCVVKGLVPEPATRRSRKVAERMVAPSGIAEVLKATTALYCLFWLSSPTRRTVAVALSEPPALEVSLDSSTQPSWAAREVKVIRLALALTTLATQLLTWNGHVGPPKARR